MIMFLRKYLLLTALICTLAGPAFSAKTKKARPKKVLPKQEVLIFNFVPEKDSATAYSFVIPYTVSKELKKNKSYSVNNIGEAKKSIPGPYNQKFKKYINGLKSATSTRQRPDYLISGSYVIEKISENETIMKVAVQVFNVRAREATQFGYESKETGAILQTTIDDLSAKISKEINAFLKKNENRYTGSPYMGLYKGLDNVRFGVDTGSLNLFGKWADLYSDTEFISFFMLFETGSLVKNTAISFTLDHVVLDNEDKNTPQESYVTFWGGTVNFHYFITVSDTLFFDFSVGGGAAYTKIDFQAPSSEGPFVPELATEDSWDPYADIAASINFRLTSLIFSFGSSYKRVIYSDEHMNVYTLFISLSYAI